MHSTLHKINLRRTMIATVGVAATVIAMIAPAAHASVRVQTVDYNATSLAQYDAMWNYMYGPLDNATETISPDGVFTASDVPFKTGTDYSVYDHLKNMSVSDRTFPAPGNGTVSFSVDLTASTPGAVAGHVVQGQYGPPGSYDPSNHAAIPYAQPTLEEQQAAVVFNMIDFCTGQLFDWFVSSHYAMPLIERLPTAVTGNTTNPDCAGASNVGLDKAYTQIIKNIPITPGRTHNVAISYSQAGKSSSVSYLFDGQVIARVTHVGIPLDKQHTKFSGTYPSLGNGEPLAGKIGPFVIGHGLFSLLDAFPFQLGCTAPTADSPGVCDPADARYSVSIPPSQRAFGQGAVGSFSHFQVVTTTR